MLSTENRFRAGIIILTLSAYALVWNCGFVNFDDPAYVPDNVNVKTGLSAENIRWAWTSTLLANWSPLTWMSLMLDATIYPPGPRGFHITNLLLHVANALLLFQVLRCMTARTALSGCVALIFAVHPVHVESVAWIAERKDVLSMFFGLIAMLAYTHYVRPGSISRGRWWYAFALFAFVCSLLSKQMLVTLPCLLLLLDVWPLQRIGSAGRSKINPGLDAADTPHDPPVSTSVPPPVRPGRLLLEKAPFLLLSVIFSVIALQVQKAGGAMEGLKHLTLDVRMANAAVAYVEYVRTVFWPSGLAIFYPHPEHGLSGLTLAISGGVLGVVTLLAVCLWKRAPFVATGWFWFLGTLVPVIGLVQVGIQQRADRYLYMPGIGIYIMAVWTLGPLLARVCPLHRVRVTTVGAVLLILTMATFWQVRRWQNSIYLWSHTVRVTERNLLAHTQLASAFNDAGLGERAAVLFREGLEEWPNDNILNANYGLYFVKRQEYEMALPYVRKSVELEPDNGTAEALLGFVLWKTGTLDEAEVILHKAIEHEPRGVRAYYYLGRIRLEQGLTKPATEFFERALKADPTYGPARRFLTQIQQGLPVD